MTLGTGGHVRVASVPCLATELLPDAITGFEDRHTGFQYSVATMNTEEIISQLDLRVGAFDLGFTLGQVQDTSLAFNEIGMAQLFAVLPSDWELAAGPEVDLAQLVDRPYVAGFDSTALGIVSNRLFAENDLVPNTIARSHAHSVAGALVARGLGFALLDLFTVYSLLQGPDRDRITVRRVAGADALPVVAIYPSRRKLSNAAAVFIECFQDAFARLERDASACNDAASASMEA
jgi:DNA-binding transcriptional LysR family regulator